MFLQDYLQIPLLGEIKHALYMYYLCFLSLIKCIQNNNVVFFNVKNKKTERLANKEHQYVDISDSIFNFFFIERSEFYLIARAVRWRVAPVRSKLYEPARGTKNVLNLQIHQENDTCSIQAFFLAPVMLCQKWLTSHSQFMVP